MDFFSSMRVSSSGLDAQMKRMNTISSNIANAETVGYKRKDTLVTAQTDLLTVIHQVDPMYAIVSAPESFLLKRRRVAPPIPFPSSGRCAPASHRVAR